MQFHTLCASDVDSVAVQVCWQGVKMSAASQQQMQLMLCKLMHHLLSFSEPIIWVTHEGPDVHEVHMHIRLPS